MYTVYLLDPRPFDSFDPTVVKLFHPHSIISSNKILCEAEQMRRTWERCKTVRTSPEGGTRQPASWRKQIAQDGGSVSLFVHFGLNFSHFVVLPAVLT